MPHQRGGPGNLRAVRQLPNVRCRDPLARFLRSLDKLRGALPPDTLSRALQLVDDLRHVHPLAVREEMSDWTCRACGETFSLAPAAVVTNTGNVDLTGVTVSDPTVTGLSETIDWQPERRRFRGHVR